MWRYFFTILSFSLIDTLVFSQISRNSGEVYDTAYDVSLILSRRMSLTRLSYATVRNHAAWLYSVRTHIIARGKVVERALMLVTRA